MGARLLLGLLWLLHWLPLAVQAALGRALGRLLYRLAGSRRRMSGRSTWAHLAAQVGRAERT